MYKRSDEFNATDTILTGHFFGDQRSNSRNLQLSCQGSYGASDILRRDSRMAVLGPRGRGRRPKVAPGEALAVLHK